MCAKLLFRPGELPQIGNQKTFNVEDILAKNLLASEYLQSLADKTFEDLVNEIYLRVKDASTWLVGLCALLVLSQIVVDAHFFLADPVRVAPLQSGVPGRVPSTFFTIMMRMQMMHLTKNEVGTFAVPPFRHGVVRCVSVLTLCCFDLKQMRTLLDHPDSPFIRCAGFLYLRYSCPFEDLLQWLVGNYRCCASMVWTPVLRAIS